jgi:hypothetical protein
VLADAGSIPAVSTKIDAQRFSVGHFLYKIPQTRGVFAPAGLHPTVIDRTLLSPGVNISALSEPRTGRSPQGKFVGQRKQKFSSRRVGEGTNDFLSITLQVTSFDMSVVIIDSYRCIGTILHVAAWRAATNTSRARSWTAEMILDFRTAKSIYIR